MMFYIVFLKMFVGSFISSFKKEWGFIVLKEKEGEYELLIIIFFRW